MKSKFEKIESFDDYLRVAKYSCGVFVTPKVLENDYDLLKKAIEERKKFNIPLVGDLVNIGRNGKEKLFRVSYIWDSGAQLSEFGSFCLKLGDGKMSMSGSLFDIVKNEFKQTSKKYSAECWFFSGNEMGAHRGVHVVVPVKTWEVVGELPEVYLN